MLTILTTILGGIGIFLIGMMMLSEGLRAAAGQALNSILRKFTKGKLRSILTGILVTLTVQSSSATTFATIGFVSAGILSFSQAIGVIFGANLGTTGTSWLVALVGFKVDVSFFALPLVGLGALMRLLLKGKRAHLGQALAGFGLLFVAINILQQGMQGVASEWDLSVYTTVGFFDRALLVLIGIMMTVVMQSSSAAVAATLTALHAGAIQLDQAAALVIGQNVGTTVTAGIACIGATLSAKRTALAHIFFNVITAVIALMILPLFIRNVDYFIESIGGFDDATSIAAFHTAFNLLGVLALLPFINSFSNLIVTILPERKSPIVKRLDESTLEVPAVAVHAANLTLKEILRELCSTSHHLLQSREVLTIKENELEELSNALSEVRKFVQRIKTDPEQKNDYSKHLSVIHALDHLERLMNALFDVIKDRHFTQESFSEIRMTLLNQISLSLHALLTEDFGTVINQIEQESKSIEHYTEDLRDVLIERAAQKHVDPHTINEQLRTLRLFDRISKHIWRASYHLLTADSALKTFKEEIVD